MTAGYNGRVAVFWSQTEIDGLEAAPVADLAIGASWSWHGCMTRLPDCNTEYSVQTEHDQALMALAGYGSVAATLESIATLAVISLTNGAQTYEAKLTLVEGQKGAVLLFENGCPARGQDFWVCAVEEYADASQSDSGNVVSFPSHRRPTQQPLVLAPHMAATAAE